MKNIDHIDEDFDFGFSFADDDTKEHNETVEQVEDLKDRIVLLYDKIEIFLDNLCKDPEKATIHWPDRVEKIQKYKRTLKKIVEGKNK